MDDTEYHGLKILAVKQFFITVIFLCFAVLANAHTNNIALEGKPMADVFSYYLTLGYRHILPDGFDHILFVVSLYLLSPKLKNVLWQATAFTIAHTITLILSMKGLIVAPPAIVEPIISLSIAFVAIENLITQRLKAGRLAIVFLFGLVHGLGFASALNELGLPRDKFYSSLISFNVGVELGQISVILFCWLAFGLWFSDKTWYRARIVQPLSVLIGLIAIFWTIQRVI